MHIIYSESESPEDDHGRINNFRKKEKNFVTLTITTPSGVSGVSVFVRDEPQQYGQERREGAHLNSKGGEQQAGGNGAVCLQRNPGDQR